MKYYSPLRYPGGKSKVAQYVKLIFEQNLLLDGHYVEPYAGGASVALDLLMNEYVSRIHINDIDEFIYSFWYCVLNDTDNLCRKINDTKVNMKQWRIQKEIQKHPKNYDRLDVAFSTFFLNRTNRSGILKAGVIGGIEQNGKWKIDARFNKEDLLNRIQKIALYKNRVSLYNEDAVSLVKRLKNELPSNTLFYFDPPYFKKGKQLYINFYNPKDHREIASLISDINKQHWIVSYDNEEEIKMMYDKFRQKVYTLSYSAGEASKGYEVIIYSDKIIIPDVENPTNKLEIKKLLRYG